MKQKKVIIIFMSMKLRQFINCLCRRRRHGGKCEQMRLCGWWGLKGNLGLGKELETLTIQLLILGVLLLVIPVFVGGIFSDVDGMRRGLVFRWISGQFLLWAGFQIISVPLIIRQRNFNQLVWGFWLYMAALMLMTVGRGIRQIQRKVPTPLVKASGKKRQVSETLFWMIFAGLLLFQLVQAVRLAYADGDDAYYVAISAMTQDADTMYLKIAYTGETTMLNFRHSLAPFPIWIAFLARVSGMQAVTVAQVVLPVVLIAMSYGIFYLLGIGLFPEKGGQLPLFLIFTEILVLFGDYSFYTAENFMIARSRQGKAALGNIVIPFLLLLLLILMKKLQEAERVPVWCYLLIGAAATTACLCSTLGALLICMMVGVAGLSAAVCYKQFRCLVPLAICCIPCICYALLYLLLSD